MKLLLDEMYSDVLAVELRGRGHDAISVREVPTALAGAPDDQVLKTAAASGRCLVTENVRDYRPLETALLAEGGHHQGIIYTTDRQFPRGLDALMRDPPTMRDRSIFLSLASD